MLLLIKDLLIFKETEGYSGSDIRLVCKEAAMRPVRKIFDTLENHSEGKTVLLVVFPSRVKAI